MLAWDHLALSFAVYSLIGWVCESVFCSILFRRFVNRGFLNGPFCPIYAVGAFLLLALFGNIRSAPDIRSMAFAPFVLLVFAVGTAVTSAVEYFTSWLLESLFHARWWDYSGNRFNLNGRVCLANSLLFGLMCVALVFCIGPLTAAGIALLPRPARELLAGAFLAYFAADFGITVASMQQFNKRLAALQKAASALRERLDGMELYAALNPRERIEKLRGLLDSDPLASLRDTMLRLSGAVRGSQLRLLRAFPEMRSTRYPELLAQLREWLPTARLARRKSRKK